MNKICCQNCGKEFIPDDENDEYCCEECLDEAYGEDDEGMND